MSKLREMYQDPRDKDKFPGPYRPKDTVVLIADDDGGSSEEEEEDTVTISRKEYEDLCRKAGM